MSKLVLVGAGPGDPELITLKAINCLEKADVVLYDALANDLLLQYAKKARVKQYVGKRFGCHTLSQTEINYSIIDFGKRYNTIVRLKGGDPFVFGRAFEEITAATEAGMDVEVVPGITSAIAVPASRMIPVTCRGMQESFWVVTGTTKTGDISKDISLAAQSSATVIILMAMSKLEAITEIFSQYGKAETAAAVIQNGTLPNEKMVTGKVKDIYFRAQYAEMQNPAVIIIGDVVNLHTMAAKQNIQRTITSTINSNF